jgi:hypothetical protein
MKAHGLLRLLDRGAGEFAIERLAMSEANTMLIRVKENLDAPQVEALSRLIEGAPAQSVVAIELSSARWVEPHALVRLLEVVRAPHLGRRVLLRGLTLGQARLLELACGTNLALAR